MSLRNQLILDIPRGYNTFEITAMFTGLQFSRKSDATRAGRHLGTGPLTSYG